MLDLFKNPPSEYRLTPIWIWNRLPDPDKVECQIRDMQLKGIGGFIIQSRLNHVNDANSKQLLDCVARAREIAKNLDMHVYLYDKNRLRNGSGSDIISLKSASSAHHIAGAEKVPARVFGRCGWSLTMEQMKHIVNYHMSLGATVFAPDAFYYSLAGVSNIIAPPAQSYQATYWPYYKYFADYTARLGYALSGGKHRAQVALLKPSMDRETGKAGALSSEFFGIYCERLLAEHIDYDIIDEQTLHRALPMDERLMIAGEEYEMIIMPPMSSISYEAAIKIREFIFEGGKVLGTIFLPVNDADGEESKEIRKLFGDIFGTDPIQFQKNIESDAKTSKPRIIHTDGRALFLTGINEYTITTILHQALRMAIKPCVSIRINGSECSDISCLHRSANGIDIFFFTNNADEAKEVQISVRSDGAPYMLNPESGDITALPNCTQQGNRTVLLHRFERYGSLLVAFGNEPAFAITLPPVEQGQEIPLKEEWEFSIHQPNNVPLPDWTFNTITQPDRDIFEYTTSFESSIELKDVAIVLENIPNFDQNDSPTLFINDNEAALTDRISKDPGYYCFDISNMVRKGSNKVKLLVPHTGWTGNPVESPVRARLAGSFSLDHDRRPAAPRKKIRIGSWTDQGYPFYSGTASYKQSVYIPDFARGQRVILRAFNPADIVEFIVNGASAGVRPWTPFEMDITPLVKPGPNNMELRITNSLANAQLSEPQPSGLIGGAVMLIS